MADKLTPEQAEAEANQRIQECLDNQATELDLSNLRLIHIPPLLTDNVQQLNQHLKRLNLSYNQISDIQPISDLTQLTWLNLSGNHISDIQPVGNLTQLTELNLSNNQTSDIQPISKLSQLAELHLFNNQISDIQSIRGLTQLTRLYLANNQISDIQPIRGLTQLNRLALSNNQISDIQPICGLTQLTRLDLFNNQISDIQPILDLTQLTWLYLANNQISNIQPIRGLTQLNRLALFNNQISDIQPILDLTQLTWLYLANNQISDIQPILGLTQLTRLDLDNNQINDIQPILDLTQLTRLYLANNQLSDITPLSPLINGKNSKLQWVTITNNPFISTSNLTLDNASNANHLDDLKLYFAKQQVDASEKINVNLPKKVLLLGNHASGKSSTLYYLQHQQLVDNTNSTHGLAVEYIDFSEHDKPAKHNDQTPASEPSHYTLPNASCYDFGGQDFYHGSYRIFMQHASLVLLLVNPAYQHNQRDEQNQETANQQTKDPLTHYFDPRYWRGLLHYIQCRHSYQQHPKQNAKPASTTPTQTNNAPTETTALQIIQSHADSYPQDWSLPALFASDFQSNLPTSDLLPTSGLPTSNPSNLSTNEQDKDKTEEKTEDNKSEDKVENNQENDQTNANHTSLATSEPNPADTTGKINTNLPLLGFHHLQLKTPEPIHATNTTDTTNTTNTQNAINNPINIANTVNQPLMDSQRQLFYQQFVHYIESQQRLEGMKTLPIKEVEFLQSLMTEVDSDHNHSHSHMPTSFGTILQQLDFLQLDTLKTQIRQYHRAGLVLYDEQLTANAEDKPLEQHIVWLYPKALIAFIHRHILSTDGLSKHQGRIAKADFLQAINQGLNEKGLDKNVENKQAIDHDPIDNKPHNEHQDKHQDKHQQAIIELLKIHQVVFQHNYRDGEEGNVEYIIPNYLPFADQNISYELSTVGMGQADIRLKFSEFLPMGMMNQFVTLFGRQPDKKLFWRDCMVFTFTHNADVQLPKEQQRQYKIRLDIDMVQLTISVYVHDIRHDAGHNSHHHSDNPYENRGKTDKNRLLKYLFYCIMNAYWHYITGLDTVDIATFEHWQQRLAEDEDFYQQDFYKTDGTRRFQQLSTADKDDEEADSYRQLVLNSISNSVSAKQYQQIDFCKQLFAVSSSYLPADMYISRNGQDYIRLTDLSALEALDTHQLTIASYRPVKINKSTAQANRLQPRMQQQDHAIAVQDFQPFTNQRLAKIARIFISYSHLDREYKEALFVHLGLLRRLGHYVFDDTQIDTGKFDQRIQDELDKADIVLFLLSANFFNSEYIFNKELRKVLQRNQTSDKKQIVIPVLIKDFDYQLLSGLTTDSFDKDGLAHFISAEENQRNEALIAECGEYLFRPYYKNQANGTGYLLPIERWADNDQNHAYRQVAEIVRKAVNDL